MNQPDQMEHGTTFVAHLAVRSRRTQVVLVLSALGAYGLLFFPTYGRMGPAAVTLAILPVAIAGWLLGMRGGLLTALFCLPLNIVLLNLVGQPGWEVLTRSGGGALGTIALVLVGGIVGWMSDLGKRAARELAARKRAEEALARRADEFAALYEITRDLAAQHDLPTLLQTIVERAARLLAAPSGGIYLFDAARGDLQLVVAEGMPISPGVRLQLGEGIAGRVAQTRQPLIVDDYHTWKHRSPQYEGIPFTAVVQVPMLYAGELIGVLAVNEIDATDASHLHRTQVQVSRRGGVTAPDSRVPREDASKRKFTQADARLLSLFATQAASAVHNARLFQETRQRAEQLALLYDAGLTLNRVLEPKSQVEFLCKIAMRALHADHAGFFRYDDAHNEICYELGAGRGADLEALRALRVPLGEERGLIGWIAQNRLPFYLPDVSADSRWIAIDPEIRSVLWVPIQHEQQLRGLLSVASTRVNAFTPHDERLLILFGNQISVAMENARLFAETTLRAQRQEALYRISTTLARVQGSQELCQAVLSAVRDVLGYPYLGIFLVDPETGDRVLQAHFGWDDAPKDWRLHPGEGLSAKAIVTGELQYWPDVTREPRYIPGLRGSRSQLDVPIKIGESVLGVLIVEDTRVDAFGSGDFAVLQAVANQLAVALERVRLFEAERRRAEEMAALVEMNRAITEDIGLKETLDRILSVARQIIPVSECSVTLVDASSGDLVVQASTDGEIGLRINPATPSAVGWVVKTKQILAEEDPSTNPLFDQVLVQRYGIQSALVVPIVYKDQSIGAIGFADCHARRVFSDSEKMMAQTFAHQAAIAIAKARLFEQTSRRLRHLQALREIDTAISSSLDLRLTFTVLLEQVTHQLGVDAADILRLVPHTHTLEYVAGRGFHTTALQHTRLRLGEGLAGRAALECRIIYVADLTKEPNGLKRAPKLADENFVAYFAAPLIAKGQVKGVLEIFHRAPLESSQEWIDFLHTLAGQAAIAIDNAELFDQMQRSNVELALAYDATIEGWSHALDLRDRETEGHTQRVVEATLRLARCMGIPEEELVHVRRGALLHDIGKMAIPDSILFKNSSLTVEEWSIMRKHPQYAYDLLSPIEYLRPALDIPYCHHEKWDGTGYPRGLKGEAIPQAARIFAVVDVWDALRSDRPYRPAWAEEQVREYLREQAGKHFDPKVVEAFLKMTSDG